MNNQPFSGNVHILQSYHTAEPGGWLATCMRSVQTWAQQNGYHYHFIDDQLFAWVPAAWRQKTQSQPVVATDLARLYWLRQMLTGSADTPVDAVVWLDADTLVFAPERFVLPNMLPDILPAAKQTKFAVGREVWLQSECTTATSDTQKQQQKKQHKTKDQAQPLRSYVKVHNAFLFFAKDNPFLDFYIHAAEQVIREYTAEYWVPQIIGPKLLTALHNVVPCPVVETAGMLSPVVIQALLEHYSRTEPQAQMKPAYYADSAAVLNLFMRKSVMAPAAVNCCRSVISQANTDTRPSTSIETITDEQMLQVVNLLLEKPDLFEKFQHGCSS